MILHRVRRNALPRLRAMAFTQVLVSPRLRARQTCELAGIAIELWNESPTPPPSPAPS